MAQRRGAANSGHVFVRGDVAGTFDAVAAGGISFALVGRRRLPICCDYFAGATTESAASSRSMRLRKAAPGRLLSPSGPYGDWSYRTAGSRDGRFIGGIFTERSDNPGMNVNLEGLVECRDGEGDCASHRGADGEVESARDGFGDDQRKSVVGDSSRFRRSAGGRSAELVSRVSAGRR